MEQLFHNRTKKRKYVSLFIIENSSHTKVRQKKKKFVDIILLISYFKGLLFELYPDIIATWSES